MLELHTKFRVISTAGKSRAGLSKPAAISRAKAALRYGMRESATPDLLWAGDRLVAAAKAAGTDRHARRRGIRLAFHHAIDERAATGGRTGARLLETASVSLPNSWPPTAQKEAIRRVLALYAPPGSEAIALAARHNDKPNNAHFHIYAQDGLESVEAAQQRAQKQGTRPRRRMAVRMGDMGAPKRMRKAIAATLNAFAAENGLEGVEARSFKERGIEKAPTTHRGPKKRKEAPAREPSTMPQGVFKPSQAAQERIDSMNKALAVKPQEIAHQAAKEQQKPKPKKIFKNGRWVTITEKPAAKKDRDRTQR